MKSEYDSMREGLLSAESWDRARHAEFETAVEQMVHRPLTQFQRISFTVVAIVVGVLGFVQLGVAFAVTQLPLTVRVGLAGLTLFNAFAVGALALVLWSGKIQLRRDPPLQAGIMWCFSVLLSVFFLILIPQFPPEQIGTALSMLGIALVTLISSGLILLRTCIEQSELNTHQRLLELALQLSDSDNEVHVPTK